MHGLIAAAAADEYVGLQLNRVGLDPDAHAPLSAPVLGRPARAHRHRPRAGGEARVPGVRRVGRGARRVDPGAGAEPVHGAARRRSISRISSSATISASSSTSATASSSCISAASSNPGRRPSSSPRRTIRTRRRCSPRSARSSRGKRTFVPIKGEIPSPLDAAARLPFPSALPARDGRSARHVAPALRRDRAGPAVGVLPERRSRDAVTRRDAQPLSARHASGRGDAAPAGPRFAAFAASTIPTISTTCRRAPSCARPRTRTSRVSIAARPRYGATLIEALFPRAYIDANRSLADIDPALLADAVAGAARPSRKTEQGIGLIWRIARGGAPMYARKLTVAEVQRRIDRWYRPYHAALAAALDARHARSAPCGTSTATRCRRSATRTPTIRAARAPTSCSAIATARRATPEFTALVAETLSRHGLQRRDQRSVQGRRARPPPRPARRAAATACRSRSIARSTWTRRRSSPTRAIRISKRDLERLSPRSHGVRRARLSARVRRDAASRRAELVRPLDRFDAAAKLRCPRRTARCPSRRTSDFPHAALTEEP